jgi:hypothetical protein
MKRDHMSLGQVSRLLRSEYRSYEANRISAYVRIEELPG